MLSRLVIASLPRSKRLFISWLQSPSAVILEPQNKVCHCFPCFSTYLPWSDEIMYPDLTFLNVEFLASSFTLLFNFHQETFQFFDFHHKNSVICVSEVTDISTSYLDSSLCFIHPSISHDVLQIKVKEAGRQYTALMYSFLNLELFSCSMSGSSCCFFICICEVINISPSNHDSSLCFIQPSISHDVLSMLS